jgi:hypothetical protein
MPIATLKVCVWLVISSFVCHLHGTNLLRLLVTSSLIADIPYFSVRTDERSELEQRAHKESKDRLFKAEQERA